MRLLTPRRPRRQMFVRKRWDDARLLTAYTMPIPKLVDRHCDIPLQLARAAINALEHNRTSQQIDSPALLFQMK